MAFVGLSLLGELPWWVTVLVLAREWGVTLLRFFVIRHGVMPAGRGGKLKTVLQSVTLTLFSLPLWVLPLSGLWTAFAWVTMVLAVVVTLVTGVDYVMKALHLRRTSERAAMKRARASRRR
jgi:CDP-diacylglycerol--glycerol-3-phosphate 3-phosphatidyltransferase